MDKAYADTVRLLLSIAPDVFAGDDFAMKGGTAINLFVQDMPRLSVDIDVVYLPYNAPRDAALGAIADHLTTIASRLKGAGVDARIVQANGLGDAKLIATAGDVQVKVEVNLVFRGAVLPVEQRRLVTPTARMFGVELSLPVLATDELYGSKLVAALDRQHPRDLFDVWRMYETVGLTDGAIECFATYLAGHNRPTHEVLFARAKDIEAEYDSTFVGMTTDPVSLDVLLAARERIFCELPARLTDAQRRLLVGLSKAEPDWTLLRCQHASDLPALRWKLANLQQFQRRRPDDFARQSAALAAGVGL